jgi:hypothetical protein
MVSTYPSNSDKLTAAVGQKICIVYATNMAQVTNKKIVNLHMDIGLWRKARIRAAEQDTTLTNIVDAAMKEYLGETKKK